MTAIIDQNKIPRRALYTGETIPAVGLGTFGSDKYGPEQVAEAVYGGIKAGYRLIDCAAVYQRSVKTRYAGRHRGKKGSVRNLQGMERHAW